jgi:hypothetical protein
MRQRADREELEQVPRSETLPNAIEPNRSPMASRHAYARPARLHERIWCCLAFQFFYLPGFKLVKPVFWQRSRADRADCSAERIFTELLNGPFRLPAVGRSSYPRP